MITWITGNSGAGKTRLAKALIEKYGGVLLDGDDMRTIWKLGFSREDRWENNLRIAKLAKILDGQGFEMIIATICPYRNLRDEVQKITNCKFIFVEGGKTGENYPYEE